MPIQFPIRLNHYLAEQKIASRRGADELILAGKVKINGKKAVIGQKVLEGDEVAVDDKAQTRLKKNRIYWAYCKPVGVVTHSPQKGEKSIAEIFPLAKNLFPVGRLDKDSRGLIILTNDGRITGPLLDPEKNHEKEYVVKVDKKIRPGMLTHMREGMTLDDYRTKPAKVTQLNEYTFRIILTEGKNRQIRRMCAAFNYAVRDLKRERIMNILLGSLKSNHHRTIKGAELETFLKSLDL